MNKIERNRLSKKEIDITDKDQVYLNVQKIKRIDDFEEKQNWSYNQLLWTFCGTAILASRKDVVQKPNATFQKQLPGQEYKYKSIICIFNDDEAEQHPIEFLNSIQTPDLQDHNSILRVGAPIMLVQNIDAARLCSGTRLIVKKLMQHVILAAVLTGWAKSEDVFIPRIPIIPSDSTIQCKRIQFPLKLCFAMTINKSQGQSLGISGIEL
ncbi:ATP-dependent DNA helicase [Trichonephila clavipes]|uniref:ATP-dependent DNA helicase n=1 Tax=Trichonephila clavipes TaxID=2585209 RepID=A0A8X6RB21_TRICX|nr:ATP-dependent DNA helicase [Trichonephila clavipes]